MTPWVPDEIVGRFISIVYDLDLAPVFDYTAWQPEFEAALQQLTSRPQEVNAITICKCFTVLVRTDRFVDGYLIRYFENGSVLRLLQQLQEIVTNNTDNPAACIA